MDDPLESAHGRIFTSVIGGTVTRVALNQMSEETTFVGARKIKDVAHIFDEEEIAYLRGQGIEDLDEIREALGKLPADSIAAGLTIEALIGEAVSDRARKAEGRVEPNVIDPTDPANAGTQSGEEGAQAAAE